ncbi:MAG: hypothetical protein JWO37_1763 [Acidimicrobiales bacterium]|jgi:hypothetical protein|nr:hypothetical protein [Acidimicrobiales bacterium]
MLDELDLPEDLADEMFFERGWTDGMAVRLPTTDRVDEFIARSGLDRDLVIGPVPPSNGIATVENIAVNALMAGCRPEHLKIVTAAMTAMLQEKFNLYVVQCTTNPVTPLTIVNGPARIDGGMNFGRGALGPGRHWNGAIGRAVRLAMGNLGGSFDENVDMATHGNPLKFSCCLAEAEEESPWDPLHVALGYSPTDSVVTTAAVEGLIDIVPSYGNTQAKHLIDHIGRAMRTIGTCYYWSQGNPVVILNPTHAHILDNEGIGRAQLQEVLFQEARVALDTMPLGNIPVGDWKVVDEHALGYARPEDLYIVVAGQTGGHHTLYAMGFALSYATSSIVPSAIG